MTDFETFWKAYPKKVAKGDARKAWKQTDQIRPELGELIEAIEAQCRSDQWRKNDGQFIPYPATWLRQERWSDELKVTLPGVVQGKELAAGRFSAKAKRPEAYMKGAR